jgi:hypothetical protein
MSYLYLGSPYSKYPLGLDAAFEEICRIAGRFAKAGIPVYSPIAHTHPIAKYSGIDPYNHAIWLPFDEPMIEGAKALVIVCMESWEISYGIEEERKTFLRLNKPIHYFNPYTNLLDGDPL